MLRPTLWISKPISRDRGACLSIASSISFAAVLAAGGCSFSDVKETTSTPAAPGEKVLLVDLTGKEWDVTTAVWKYGFEVEGFEHGLGPDYFKPILNPQMLSPGDDGYPEDGKTFPVIGTSIGGDSRAYAVLDVAPHEVVDDRFGAVWLAVTY